MRKLFIGLCFSVAVALIAHSAPPRAAQANQRPAVPSSTPEDILKRFLQGYVGKDGEKATRYFHAFVDLDGDGKNEVIVYLAGLSFVEAAAAQR